MTPLTQKIYWKLPYFAKCWAASFNARKLDKQRHGEIFDQTTKEIESRNKWSTEQFKNYQYETLSKLIRHAAAKVPHYQKMFNELKIDPNSIKCLEDLQKIPILEKSVVRQNSENLLDETLDKKSLFRIYTSGSTGTPLALYSDKKFASAAFAYGETRWHGIAGMHRRINPSVSLGGHLVAEPGRNRPPFWVYNRRWDQLYMSSYHLAPDYIKHYVDELRRFNADYIEGIPSSIYAVAKYIIENEIEPIPFKACFTTSETLFEYQRQAIAKAFMCRTYNQYGCTEYVVFAAECEHGSMHLSPEVCIVEVVDDDDKPLPHGETGNLICTSLINRVQTFIRYRVGDVGSLKAGKCACGSSLPMMGTIEGRIDDVLISPDGRRIGHLDVVYGGLTGIMEAQIVQDDISSFRVRVVPTKSYHDEDGQKIKESLLKYIGSGNVTIELVDWIERTPAGKFKAIVSDFAKR